MPYRPNFPIPYNNAISATENNEFSCLIDDYDTIIKSQLFIYDITNNNEKIYSVEKTEANNGDNIEENNYPLRGGGGDDSRLVVMVPKNTLTNGREYKWKIRLYGDKNDVWIVDGKTPNTSTSTLSNITVSNNSRVEIGMVIAIKNENRYITNVSRNLTNNTMTITFSSSIASVPTKSSYVITSNFVESVEYYFRTIENFPLTILPELNTSNKFLESGFGEFTANFDGNISCHLWELKRKVGDDFVTIDKTKEIFSSNIYYKYDGFLTDNIYMLTLTVNTKENSPTIFKNMEFSVKYELLPMTVAPFIGVDYKRKAIKVDFSNALEILGNSEIKNGYDLTEVDSSSLCFVKSDNTITWNTISGIGDLNIPSEFTMALRIQGSSLFKGDVFELVSVDGSIYKMWIDNEYFYYTIGKNQVVRTDIYSPIIPPLSMMQENNTVIERCRYEFRYDEPWYADNSHHIIFNDDFKKYWWNIYVFNNGVVFYCDDGVNTMLLADTRKHSLVNVDVNYKSVKIFGDIYYNYVNVFKNTLSETEIIENNDKHSHSPLWVGNTYLLANFADNINASNMSEVDGTLIQYIVNRENLSNNSSMKIATIEPSKTVLYDYAVNKQYEYRYLITPVYSDNKSQKLLMGASIVTNAINPNWYSLSIIGTKTPSNNLYDNIYEADVTNIWDFTLNVDNPIINVITDETIYDGVFKYAKVNQGLKNYKSGSVSALLGSINCEKHIYEDFVWLADKWQEFTNNGTVKLLRDQQGNHIPVHITTKSFEYNNNMVPMSIVVSFDWVQVNNEYTVSVYEVGGVA